jgi:dTDP-4-amino-4,6-dideoxy-D-galactose acyltransferase
MDACEFLPWDSAFFGRRIGRIAGHQLNPQQLEEILEWCRGNRIECLYFVADSDHPETIRLAEEHGFRLVDVRVTVERKTSPLPRALSEGLSDEVQIRFSRKEDIHVLEAMARTAFRNTRFYSDGHFPTEACDHLYETWIRSSCEGYADAVLVVEVKNQPVGFVTCHLPKGSSSGSLGLLGVDSQVRGRGLGQILLTHALHWFAERGVGEITAPIPGCNIPSQRLYQHLGFLTRSVQLYYHWWVAAGDSGEAP